MALFPTKGNLVIAKNTLKLSKQGYELLDKKRNILVREMMSLINDAYEVQSQIDSIFSEAYTALQHANISMGITGVAEIGYAIKDIDSIDIKFKSIMGVEIPIISVDDQSLTQQQDNFKMRPSYGFIRTTSALDEAFYKFQKVTRLILKLSQIENGIYRLAFNIKKTQKRANALKNIMIPKFEQITKDIQEYLEEKEREEFARLKVIKRTKK